MVTSSERLLSPALAKALTLMRSTGLVRAKSVFINFRIKHIHLALHTHTVPEKSSTCNAAFHVSSESLVTMKSYKPFKLQS